ncbi:hypothetical protein [Nonomuraea sp. B19D2]|uniref:hypothetical protein n=1 Tax=Nonomuraea sp. B19D2 TaxID=3159561 RepID=UPI0032DACD8D
MTTDIDCNCDAPSEVRLGPCPTHEADKYWAWLTERAPRLAAAEKAGDPFIERLADSYPNADEVHEFAAFRKALSQPARDLFDEDWKLGDSEPWPGQWELALKIRDDWQNLVTAQERQALRAELAHTFGADEYPYSDDETSPYRHNLDDTNTPEQLLAEADQIADLIQDAQRLERLLRDHAAGSNLRADQV